MQVTGSDVYPSDVSGETILFHLLGARMEESSKDVMELIGLKVWQFPSTVLDGRLILLFLRLIYLIKCL